MRGLHAGILRGTELISPVFGCGAKEAHEAGRQEGAAGKAVLAGSVSGIWDAWRG